MRAEHHGGYARPFQQSRYHEEKNCGGGDEMGRKVDQELRSGGNELVVVLQMTIPVMMALLRTQTLHEARAFRVRCRVTPEQQIVQIRVRHIQ